MGNNIWYYSGILFCHKENRDICRKMSLRLSERQIPPCFLSYAIPRSALLYVCMGVGGGIGHEVRNGTMRREEGIFRRVERRSLSCDIKATRCGVGCVCVCLSSRGQAREWGDNRKKVCIIML